MITTSKTLTQIPTMFHQVNNIMATTFGTPTLTVFLGRITDVSEALLAITIERKPVISLPKVPSILFPGQTLSKAPFLCLTDYNH